VASNVNVISNRAGSTLREVRDASAGAASRLSRSTINALRENALSAALPDAIVYGNSRMLAQSNAKHFALFNPLTRTATHFVSYPEDRVTVMGLPFNRIETVTYTPGAKPRREDGFGRVWMVGSGPGAVKLFVNGRIGDSNLGSNGGVSVNAGFFASPFDVLSSLTDRLPSSGPIGRVRQALNWGLDAGSATGTLFGLGWRGSLQYNNSSDTVGLTVSGVTGSVSLRRDQVTPTAINSGVRSIARANNEEAYLRGANPFQRADDTRSPTGVYLNHGSDVAAIANDVLRLQDHMNSRGETNIRTNAQARRFLEGAIARTRLPPWSPNRMSAGDRTALQNLLVRMDRNEMYFQSPSIQAAARRASLIEAAMRQDAARTSAPAANPASRAFVRDVFEGRYRQNSIERPYGPGELARDVALGLNRYAGPVLYAITPRPTADNDTMYQQWRHDIHGLQARMDTLGGTLRELGIEVSPGMNTSNAERAATEALSRTLRTRALSAGQTPTAQAMFEQFGQLSPSDRAKLTGDVQRAVDASSTSNP
jgi:hypothetical protein